MQKMNGTDYTLYLVYLRYAAYFCFVITLINLGVMIPLYVSGEPAQADNWKTLGYSSMNNLTILNITASQDKFDFVYLFTILVVSALAYWMIFLYQQKYEAYKLKIKPNKDDFDDISIARYSLQVTNLPTNFGKSEMEDTIKEQMVKIYQIDKLTGQSPFMEVRVMGDYNGLYQKCVKLKQNMDKLEAIRRLN